MSAHTPTFAILLDGSLTVDDRLREDMARCRVIAADGGIRHAQALGVTPEVWIGDFDSAGNGFDAEFAGVERQNWPQDKAKSDGELAIDAAIRRGAQSIILVGALGGERTDHALFNLAMLVTTAEKGITISATSGIETAWPISGPANLELDLPPDTILSVFGFDALEGLSLEGVKWPLVAVDVAFSSTWTLSNEATGKVKLSLRAGRAVVLAGKKKLD